MPLLNFQQFAGLLALLDANLVERVTALEERDKEVRHAEPLKEHNASRQAEGERLREAVRELLERHPGPPRGAAKRIYPHLLETEIGRTTQPSLRSVQWHITQTRKT